MRKCLTRFSREFVFGAAPCQSRVPCAPSFRYYPQASLHCCGLLVSSPGQCFSPGWRVPEARFMVFRLDSKGANMRKSVDLKTATKCEHRLRHRWERALQNKMTSIVFLHSQYFDMYIWYIFRSLLATLCTPETSFGPWTIGPNCRWLAHVLYQRKRDQTSRIPKDTSFAWSSSSSSVAWLLIRSIAGGDLRSIFLHLRPVDGIRKHNEGIPFRPWGRQFTPIICRLKTHRSCFTLDACFARELKNAFQCNPIK